ncbi:DNA repair protein [Roseivirga seohaensis subsp. aquiponti]|uniref:DNA repair protein RecN n=1 Tax=Roseivirga seohaensis subsp. aquiponti TaxID=1566026 RepID=A0A0L8AQ59_9BACT|nr:DNA repair protein RecN [Roseivirga seohaensis]KOF04317.1 DNA repair protein [Roseivirga seohaensis subsp. aquiponti]
MLQRLSIENYALIQQLEINPDAQLNIITGETGAGKSIILGALGLLLGNRADSKSLLDQEKKCVIEGVFDISAYQLTALFEENDMDYDVECIIRREISPNGKSRAFINDGVTNLDFLKLLGKRLMDIHSQHDNLLLGSNGYQLSLVDAFAQNNALLQKYSKAFSDYREKYEILEQLKSESADLKKEADYHQFLFDELDKAQLQADEQEILEAELNKLENAEEIKLKLNEALSALDQSEFNANQMLQGAKTALGQINKFAKKYDSLFERLNSSWIELKDIIAELETEEEQVEYEPQRAEEVQERLSLIYKLQQKHQVSDIASLLSIYEELGNKVLKVGNLDDAIEAAEKQTNLAFELVETSGEALSQSRTKVFAGFENQIGALLDDLGMPHAKLAIQHEKQAPSESGVDKINLLFSANKGIAPQPLKQVASGGEFSRLMFAVKYILADKTALPTIVFDEIDAGISGEISIQMAEMMNKMAQNHQVITITHLPQIAARGKSHYYVYKDNAQDVTASNIRKLNHDERLSELAQMIGGKQFSESSLESARELMK